MLYSFEFFYRATHIFRLAACEHGNSHSRENILNVVCALEADVRKLQDLVFTAIVPPEDAGRAYERSVACTLAPTKPIDARLHFCGYLDASRVIGIQHRK